MKLPQIITSLLETDLYKFSMGQAIYHQFSEYKTTWTFKCRNKDVTFTKEMIDEIKEQIQTYCNLRFTEEELAYLSTITWLKESYINHLRRWKPRFNDFTILNDGENGLIVEASGTWLDTSMYEIPTLAIINEVYFKCAFNYKVLIDDFKNRTDRKINAIKTNEYYIPIFSEFGLRRRLSAEAQEYAIQKLIEINNHKDCKSVFIGTSNAYLAKKYKIKAVGTMAHEWIMCTGQGNHLYNPAYSNKVALDAWIKEYGIDNGIALTDTITTDCFLKDFNRTLATLFSGVRHDSGDPILWGKKMLSHYEKLGINAQNKTLLFSDSLDFQKATEIAKCFKNKANIAFGIGTYISNDTFVNPLNIVMKVTKCNGQDVAKISDTSGKGMCKNPEYVDYLQRCIDWRMEHND